MKYYKHKYITKKIDWNTIKKLAKLIGSKIKKDKFYPDVIVPILRGGMPLALILSQDLGIRNFETIQVVKSRNDKINSAFGKARVVNHTNMKLIRNKNILIVEDVIDTLDTLNTAIEIIKRYKPKKILITTLFNFTRNKNYNIVVGKSYLKNKYWIIFPWD